jgi:hypothetical protein
MISGVPTGKIYRRKPMKKFVAVLAAVLLVAVVTAPAFAQQQAPKGIEGPDVRKQEPKGTEGPDVRKKAKKKTASSVAPKGTEGPDVKKQAPKGVEGPDVSKGAQKKAQ